MVISQALYSSEGHQLAQPRERTAPGLSRWRGPALGVPPGIWVCRASAVSCLLKVLVTGSRECSDQHYELAEVHLGVSVGIQVLEQLVHSLLLLSTLGETEGRGQ